jgi:two-component system NtrC family sensor kinase
MSFPTPIRRELMLSFAVLFTGAVLIAVIGFFLALPRIDTGEEAAVFIFIILLGDLTVLFFIGRFLLARSVLNPIDLLVSDSHRIASGDYQHRIHPVDSKELEALRVSVNAMADRLIQDQASLAENVASLEEANLELVQARDQVVHAARLASVGTLASGIAHEVGNPLGAIMGYVDVIRMRLQVAGEDADILDSIQEEAQRIDRIVRSLLDFSRAKAEEPTPSSPTRVVERVRDLLEAQGRLDNVKVRWDVEQEVPDVVMDPLRLEQVLVNLLLNALDALEGKDDPIIEVSVSHGPGPSAFMPKRREDDPPGINYAHRRRFGPRTADESVGSLMAAEEIVVLGVSDNGPGLAEEHMERLFDPFFTTKEPGKGTGLGLAISAQLIEGMGGRISAGNGPLGGAEFAVRLPSVTNPHAPRPADDGVEPTEEEAPKEGGGEDTPD